MNEINKLVIPTELKNKIDSLGLTEKQVGYVYKFIEIFLRNIEYNEYSMGYLPMPAKYWAKIFGSRYYKILEPLKKEGVVEVQGNWINGRFVESYLPYGFCKSYKLNSLYLSGNLTEVSYTRVQQSKTKKITIHSRPFAIDTIKADLSSLQFNKTNLTKAAHKQINQITRHSFLVDEQIKDASFEIVNSGFDSYISLEKALQLAKQARTNLIKDGSKFYFYNIDDYIFEKHKRVFWYNSYNINRLLNEDFYAGRNKTNNRLDHNLTVISKGLLDAIMDDNCLVEIDLKNSQFAILAHIISNTKNLQLTEDFDVFKEHTAAGTLYEFIQQLFGLKTREDAKSCMMELAFSSHRNNSALKKQLKDAFPCVVNYVDTFKAQAIKKYGKGEHRRFAISLQKKEANIFIDNIYYNLKKKGFWVITKHDSLIVKYDDAKEIGALVTDYFKKINFQCSLK